jgi:hypothetical protein
VTVSVPLQLCNTSLWIIYILHSQVYHSLDGDMTKVVASLLPQKPRFSPRPVFVRFVVDKWHRDSFSQSTLVFPCLFNSTNVVHSSITDSV